MSEIKDISICFEGRKTSLAQNKDGIILRIAIHPNDVPTQLIQDWVGTRYMVAMTRIADDDTPEAGDYTERANRAIQSAGMLCRNPDFQNYLMTAGWVAPVADDNPQDAAANGIRAACGIESRTEFRTNKDALDTFDRLREDFQDWMERGQHR